MHLEAEKKRLFYMGNGISLKATISDISSPYAPTYDTMQASQTSSPVIRDRMSAEHDSKLRKHRKVRLKCLTTDEEQ